MSTPRDTNKLGQGTFFLQPLISTNVSLVTQDSLTSKAVRQLLKKIGGHL